MTFRIHRSSDRGGANYSWLDTKHSFSFAHYFNPQRMGFGALRVINEDVIAPDSGFSIHPHRDMEIVSYVREGTLSHKDTEGHSGDISKGIVQRMSAGKGIQHSEMNLSKEKQVHLFQMWIDTKEVEIQPSYEEFHLEMEDRMNKIVPIASGYDIHSGKALYIHQDAEILLGHLDTKSSAYHRLRNLNHGAYVQVTAGQMDVNGYLLSQGDALEITNEPKLRFRTDKKSSEFLVFDVPLDDYLDPKAPKRFW